VERGRLSHLLAVELRTGSVMSDANGGAPPSSGFGLVEHDGLWYAPCICEGGAYMGTQIVPCLVRCQRCGSPVAETDEEGKSTLMWVGGEEP